MANLETADKIMHVLKENNEGLTFGKIAKKVGVVKKSVIETCDFLEKYGLITIDKTANKETKYLAKIK